MRKGKRCGSEQQFPGKLHDMMEYVEKQGLENAICWVMEGRAVKVVDTKHLVKILPLFFGQTKFRSFSRQMNMWHFDRILDGPHKGSFFHPCFIRGQKKLCRWMSRHGVRVPFENSTPLQGFGQSQPQFLPPSTQTVSGLFDGMHPLGLTSSLSLTEAINKTLEKTIEDMEQMVQIKPVDIEPLRVFPEICADDDLAQFEGRQFYPVEKLDIASTLPETSATHCISPVDAVDLGTWRRNDYEDSFHFIS